MRHRVGCKIYSNKDERARLDEILSSQSKKSPIEIGFYNKDGQYGLDNEFMEILESRFKGFDKKIVHLSIKHVLFRYGKNAKEWLCGLEHEISAAQRAGALYAIIHDSKWRASVRAQDEFLKNMAQGTKLLKQEFSLPLYLENTFEGIAFYERFFDMCEGEINFCFDVGHTRVWSEDSYEEWQMFLRKLHKNGVKLHFHIHTNNYVYDEHLSFVQKEDGETKKFVKELISEFGESYFILEIQQDFKECVEMFDGF